MNEHTFDYTEDMEMVREAVKSAGETVDAAARVLTWTVDPGELAEVTKDVIALRDRVDALMAQFMMHVEQCGAPRSTGVRTAGQLVGVETSADPASVRVALARGRWLRDFPLFEAAFAAAEISGSHLDVLRRTVDGPLTHWQLVEEQDFFLDAARDCSFADFKKVAAYWLIAVDPDGDEPREQEERTGLSMRKGRGGRLFIRGELDAISGEVVHAAVGRRAQQMAAADQDQGVVRTEAQRHAAALVELVSQGFARPGTPTPPLINIVMSQRVAEYLIEQAAEPTSDPSPVRWDDVDGRCELIDGTPIHPKQVLSLFGVATFRRHILDARSRAIDVSVNARAFPAWMRNVFHIQARGGCETPGCDAPHRWMQADHVRPSSRGGKTRLANGQNLCAADNQAKTNTLLLAPSLVTTATSGRGP